MTAPRASVVIPVRNGARTLPSVLAALSAQDVPLEVIGIDSASTDGSAALLEKHGARVIRIARETFDHGETRNLGAREAVAETVLFLSQDAVPDGASYARRLADALDAEPRLAGAFARQVPRPGADALTRRDLGAWVAASEAPRMAFASPAELAALPPLERHRLTAFDNVASAVRRSVLLTEPFRKARFGEDLEWGARLVRRGFGIAFVPAAVVIHSHERSARSLFRRNYENHRALCREFGLVTIPDAPHLVRAVAGSLWSDAATLARDGGSVAQWACAPAQAFAATLGQYRGARDELRQRPYPEWA